MPYMDQSFFKNTLCCGWMGWGRSILRSERVFYWRSIVERISRPRFYRRRSFVLRRGFRIWPLYFFTFLCVITCYLIGDTMYRHRNMAGQTSFSSQTSRSRLGHGWLVPLHRGAVLYCHTTCSVVCVRYARSITRYRPWLWETLLSVLLLRTFVWLHITNGHFFEHGPKLFGQIYESSLIHCDGLIMGLIIANV